MNDAKIDIQLTNNKIVFLNEPIFGQFMLNKKNVILSLYGNPFECFCENKWLVVHSNILKGRILGMKCKLNDEKRDIFEYIESQFGECIISENLLLISENAKIIPDELKMLGTKLQPILAMAQQNGIQYNKIKN